MRRLYAQAGLCLCCSQTIWARFSCGKAYILMLSLLVASVDNLCKQFWLRSGPTKCLAWSGSKLFDTLMVFLKEFFEKVDFEKVKELRYNNLSFTTMHCSYVTVTDYRPPGKSAYLKIIFLISQPKHMLWEFKRTVSMRRFFWAPKTYVLIDGYRNKCNFRYTNNPYLDLYDYFYKIIYIMALKAQSL